MWFNQFPLRTMPVGGRGFVAAWVILASEKEIHVRGDFDYVTSPTGVFNVGIRRISENLYELDLSTVHGFVAMVAKSTSPSTKNLIPAEWVADFR